MICRRTLGVASILIALAACSTDDLSSRPLATTTAAGAATSAPGTQSEELPATEVTATIDTTSPVQTQDSSSCDLTSLVGFGSDAWSGTLTSTSTVADVHSDAFALTLTVTELSMDVVENLLDNGAAARTETLAIVSKEVADSDGGITTASTLDARMFDEPIEALVVSRRLDLGGDRSLQQVLSVLTPSAEGDWEFIGECASYANRDLEMMQRHFGIDTPTLLRRWLTSPRSDTTNMREMDETYAAVLAGN